MNNWNLPPGCISSDLEPRSYHPDRTDLERHYAIMAECDRKRKELWAQHDEVARKLKAHQVIDGRQHRIDPCVAMKRTK